MNDIKSLQLILNDLYKNESWNEHKIKVYEAQLLLLMKQKGDNNEN